MASGFYVFWSVVVFLVARAWLVPLWSRRRHALLSAALVGVGLFVFAALSDAVGVPILRPGSPVSYNLPADYLARGVAGWAVMAASVLGALSPLIVALKLHGWADSAIT